MGKKVMVGVRLHPAERDALERACHHDHRSMSALGRKLLVEWMRDGGWLPTPCTGNHEDGPPAGPGHDRAASAD